MNKPSLKKILDHPDKDEIISKLALNTIPSKDISEWLSCKYNDVNDVKLKISAKTLDEFKNNYLDIYEIIKKDVVSVRHELKTLDCEQEADLAVKNNPAYKDIVVKIAQGELDIKQMMAKLIVSAETRLGQIYDLIQENPENVRIDRILLDYFDKLGILLEKYHKIVFNVPDQVVQHNVTVQVIDQQVTTIQDAIREVLMQMDIDTSMKFMELFNEKISKLKLQNNSIAPMANAELRLAEAKMLSQTIMDGIENA